MLNEILVDNFVDLPGWSYYVTFNTGVHFHMGNFLSRTVTILADVCSNVLLVFAGFRRQSAERPTYSGGGGGGGNTTDGVNFGSGTVMCDRAG